MRAFAWLFVLGVSWGMVAHGYSTEADGSRQRPLSQKSRDKTKGQQGARYVWRQLHQAMPLLWPSVRLEITAQSGYSAGTPGAERVRVSQEFVHWLERNSRDKREFRGFVAFVLAHELAHVRGDGPNGGSAQADFSPKSSPKDSSLQREAAADTFGAMALITLSHDELLPVRLFRLLRQRAQGTGEGRGFADHLEQREILYLRRLGRIKKAGFLFHMAMADLLSARAKEVARAVASLEDARRQLQKVDLRGLSLVDYALATAHHRLWLIRGNDPYYLLVRPSFYTPRSLFATTKAAPGKKILGNRYNYHKARRYYAEALAGAPEPWRARIKIQQALLTMYRAGPPAVPRALMERSLRNKQSCFVYNNATALALYRYGREGKAPKELSPALDRLQQCLDSGRLKGQALLRKKIYYHLALAAKLRGQGQALKRWRRRLTAQPEASRAWLGVLTEGSRAVASRAEPRGVSGHKWLSSIKKRLPFSIQDSWPEVQRRLRRRYPEKLSWSRREAGGWLFVRVKVGGKLYYRLFFNQKESAEPWRLVRASLSRAYLSKLGRGVPQALLARLGQPAQQKGGWLFYPDYGLHLRYGLKHGSSRLQEVTLSQD